MANLGYRAQYGYWSDLGPKDCGGPYFCHLRWHDSIIGRWISRDPSGLDGGVNTYAYCGGDPVMGADPSGLDTFFGGIRWRSYDSPEQRNADAAANARFFGGVRDGFFGSVQGAISGILGWYLPRDDNDGFLGLGLPGFIDPAGYSLHEIKQSAQGVSAVSKEIWTGDPRGFGVVYGVGLFGFVTAGAGEVGAGFEAKMIDYPNAGGRGFNIYHIVPGEKPARVFSVDKHIWKGSRGKPYKQYHFHIGKSGAHLPWQTGKYFRGLFK